MRTLYNSLIGPELYNSARDPDGHGSHTAGTATGNADVAAEIFGIDRGLITGIASSSSCRGLQRLRRPRLLRW